MYKVVGIAGNRDNDNEETGKKRKFEKLFTTNGFFFV